MRRFGILIAVIAVLSLTAPTITRALSKDSPCKPIADQKLEELLAKAKWIKCAVGDVVLIDLQWQPPDKLPPESLLRNGPGL